MCNVNNNKGNFSNLNYGAITYNITGGTGMFEGSHGAMVDTFVATNVRVNSNVLYYCSYLNVFISYLKTKQKSQTTRVHRSLLTRGASSGSRTKFNSTQLATTAESSIYFLTAPLMKQSQKKNKTQLNSLSYYPFAFIIATTTWWSFFNQPTGIYTHSFQTVRFTTTTMKTIMRR